MIMVTHYESELPSTITDRLFLKRIHDFAKQEASYHSTSIPIPNCGFMLEFGYAMRKDTPMTAIVQEFIYDLKKKLL